MTGASCKPAPQAAAAPPSSSAPRQGGTVVIGTLADLVSVNEVIAGGSIFADDMAQRFLFVRLLEEQPDYQEHPPTFAPQLAERYEWSADHLILTLHLRSDVVWSDGVPVTAEDVRFTWQAQTSPDIAWENGYLKESIKDVEVVDPHTVRMRFAHAYFAQLADANEGVILPKHAWGVLPFAQWRSSAAWFRDHLVVAGPFTLASWTPQQEIVLARNPKYFRPGLPRLDRVVFRVQPDASGMVEQLLAGQLDFVEQISARQAERVRTSERTRLLSYWSRQYTFVCWNTRRPQFADPEVRRALAMAIDRQRLIDTLWGGHARLSSSPVISDVWAHDKTLAPLPYDPREARRILNARGWKDSDGDGILDRAGKPLRFELLTNTGNSIRADAAAMIQEQLKRIGVDAQPRQIEGNTMNDKGQKHDFDAMIQGFGIDTSLDLAYAFATESIKDGNNFAAYSNPEVDRLLRQARAQTEPALAKPILDRVQQILYREQPIATLWEPQRLDAASRRLQGAAPNALTAFFNVREWWVLEQP